MKKNKRIKANIEKRTTQPRTECGRSYEHEWHAYGTKSGRKSCDGVFRHRKTGES